MKNHSYTKEELFNTDEYREWSLLKLYLYKKGNVNADVKFELYRKALGGITYNDFIGILNDPNRTKFRIKIEENNPIKNTQLRSIDYKYDNKNKNYARLIASIEYEDGKFIEVSIANIKQDLKLFENKLNDKIDNPIYIDLDDKTNENLVKNGFQLIKFTSFSTNSTNNEKNSNKYGVSVEEYLRLHPEIQASDTVYYDLKGEAYIFIDDNGSKGEDLRTRYLNEVDTTVRKVKVEVANMPIDVFISEFKNLQEKAHSANIDNFFRFKYLVPETLGGRILSALFEYRDKLINARNNSSILEEDNLESEEFNNESEKINGLIRKSIKPKISDVEEELKEVNRVIRETLEKLQSLKGLSIKYYNKNINVGTIQKALDSGDILGIKSLGSNLDYGKENTNVSDDLSDIPKFTEEEINYIYSRNKSNSQTRTLKQILEDVINSKGSIAGVKKSDDFRKKSELALKLMNNINANLLSHNIQQVLNFLNSSHIAVFNKNLTVSRLLLNDRNSEISKRAMLYSGAFNRGVWTTGKKVTDYDEYGIPANAGLDRVYFPYSITERKGILPLKFKESTQQVSNTPSIDPIDEFLKSKEVESIPEEQRTYIRNKFTNSKNGAVFVLDNANSIKRIIKDKNGFVIEQVSYAQKLEELLNNSSKKILWNDGKIYISNTEGDTITIYEVTYRAGNYNYKIIDNAKNKLKDVYNKLNSNNTSNNSSDNVSDNKPDISEFAKSIKEFIENPSSNVLRDSVNIEGKDISFNNIDAKQHLLDNINKVNSEEEIMNLLLGLFKIQFNNAEYEGNGNFVLEYPKDKPENGNKLNLIKKTIFKSITTDDFKNHINSNKSINNCNIK